MKSLTVWFAAGLLTACAVTGQAQSSELSIVMTASPTSVAVGGIVTYSLTIRNNGPDQALHVRVTDDLPSNLVNPTFESQIGTCTGTDRDTGAGRRTSVLCVAAALSAGQSFVVTIAGVVDSGTSVANTAQVSSPFFDPIASNNSATSNVTVTGSTPGRLVVDGALTFERSSSTSGPSVRSLRISSTGGSIQWTAQASTVTGGNWLALSSTSGSASAAAGSTVQVTVNAGSLTPGAYSGSVRVTSPTTNETQTLPVTLLITGSGPVVLLGQSGLLFTAVQGSGRQAPQGFAVANSGDGSMSWTTEVSTQSGGGWLSVSPTTGTSTAGGPVPRVDVTVNATGLAVGQYIGLVQVRATSAGNSPQQVVVVLSVIAAGGATRILAQPSGLIFSKSETGAVSPAQEMRIATSAAAGQLVGVLATTGSGGDWLEVFPDTSAPGVCTGTCFNTTASTPSVILVRIANMTIPAGVHQGTIFFSFGPTGLVTVPVVLVVASSSAPSTGVHPAGHIPVAAACVPKALQAVFRTLGGLASSSVSWPNPVEVQVADDCGNATGAATVIASFSHGDPPLVLTSLGNGVYAATWRPVNPATQITVTARVSLPPLTEAVLRAQTAINANPTFPSLFTGGVVSGASFAAAAPLAPGGIVSVFGKSFASSTNAAPSLPLATNLGGVSLNVGGVDVPLFFTSTGQINAQMPFELPINARLQALVRAGTSATLPDSITLAAARPGIFTTNQQGTGQGAILDGQGRLVSGTTGAAVGDIVAVYATGLGITAPTVKSGEAAPGSTLALVTNTVTAEVGGRPATVHFSGLAPGFVGLYQVNVQVPAGTTPGASVPLVLIQNGVSSNTVTLAVR